MRRRTSFGKRKRKKIHWYYSPFIGAGYVFPFFLFDQSYRTAKKFFKIENAIYEVEGN